MNKMKKFDMAHEASMRMIQSFRDIEEGAYDYGMVCLVDWMLETNINPYTYLDKRYAEWVNSSTGFLSLLNTIHHALYDDGDIEFVSVDGQPKMVFANRHDDNFYDAVLNSSDIGMGVRKGSTPDEMVEVLDITPQEFIDLCNKHHKDHIIKCYITDAARNGVAFADSHYSSYDCWEEWWRDEYADEIQWQKEVYEGVGL